MKKLFSLFLALFITHTAWSQYPLVSIFDLTFVDQQSLAAGNDTSAYFGDTIQVEGVVMFDPCAYALSGTQSRIATWLQDADNPGPWSGIHILIDPGALDGYTGSLSDLDNAVNFIDNFQVGNKVRATGIVTKFSGYTQIVLLPEQSQVIGLESLPQPIPLQISDFMQSDGAGGQVQQLETGEPYEGVLVMIENARVVDLSAGTGNATGRYFWSLQDNNGNKIQIRDVSGYIRNTDTDEFCTGSTYTPGTFEPPNLNALIDTMVGMIVEFDGAYYLAPRTLLDIGNVLASPPIVSNIKRDPVVASSTDQVTISATIIDSDGFVDQAEVRYAVGWGNTNYTSVPMTQVGSTDVWEGVIPATGTDSIFVNFYVHATDNDGNETSFPDPAASMSFYYVIDAGISDISIIQNTPLPNGNSIWQNDTLKNIDIRGVVTASARSYDLGEVAIQDGTGPWSGVFVRGVTGSGVNDLLRGDSIQITEALVIEQFGLTILNRVVFNLISSGNDLPEPELGLNPDSIRLEVFDQAEAYEGVLIGFENAYVVDLNADAPSNFGEFVINLDENATNGLRVDDRSNNIPFAFNDDSLSVGQELGFLYGVLSYTFSNFKLWPRNLADIHGFTTNYPKNITSFAFLDVQAFGSVDQTTQEINVLVPSGTDVTALVPTIEITGVSIDPPSGEANDFTTSQTYTVTAPVDGSTRDYTVIVDIEVGIEEFMPRTMQLYPNPAQNRINFEWIQPVDTDVQISLYDMQGRVVFNDTRSFTAGVANTSVGLWNIPAGVYVVKLESEQQVYRTKVQVVK